MELLTLAIVNAVTAIILYVFFSIRMSVALEKIKTKGMPEDFKKNIQATVEYINTSLEILDHKTAAFYRLVRRAEELMKQMEEGPRRKGKKKGKISLPEETDEKTMPTGRSSYRGDKRSDLSSMENDPFMRILDSSPSDSLDISSSDDGASQIFQSGDFSSRYFNPPAAQASSAGGMLGGIGRSLRKFFGLGDIAPTASSSLPPVPSTPRGPDFGKVLEIEKNVIERLKKANEQAAERAGPPRKDSLEFSPESIEKLTMAAFGREEKREEKAPQYEEPDEITPDETLEKRMDYFLSRETQDNFTMDAAEDTIEIPSGPKRGEVVRLLLGSGYKKEEISQLTGIGLAEVELILSLPALPRKPRKNKL